MITVVIGMTVKQGYESRFKAGLRDAIKRARERDIPGLRYLRFARKLDGTNERFLLIVEFESSAAMHAVREDPQDAWMKDLVETVDVEYWEAADIDFDPDSWAPVYPEKYAGREPVTA